MTLFALLCRIDSWQFLESAFDGFHHLRLVFGSKLALSAGIKERMLVHLVKIYLDYRVFITIHIVHLLLDFTHTLLSLS